MNRVGRIVPPEEVCEATGCQSSRRYPETRWCAFHGRVEATRRAQIAWEERKRRWRERDAAARAAGQPVIERCPAHPDEELDGCRGCEAIAEEAIQTGRTKGDGGSADV